MTDPFSLLYLPVAVGLGALHALEPGHSKTLMASYLIGTKGTKRDAVLLGISAAITHSFIVIALSITALWLGREAFTDQAMHWLQIGSAWVVIVLGAWMLWRRWPRTSAHVHHHHAPNPFHVPSERTPGEVAIIDTPAGERMRFLGVAPRGIEITVRIARSQGVDEVLPLRPVTGKLNEFISDVAPAEPHEFTATVNFDHENQKECFPFTMHEPEGHGTHDDLDDDAHARAHAAAMPAYVVGGERPSAGQVIAFGAAGGMIPCPASVTVMLLALSTGKTVLGVTAVLCFSLGLAAALVGVGLVVVAGISQLTKGGRFSWFSRQAPLISAGLVITTGVVALAVAH